MAPFGAACLLASLAGLVAVWLTAPDLLTAHRVALPPGRVVHAPGAQWLSDARVRSVVVGLEGSGAGELGARGVEGRAGQRIAGPLHRPSDPAVATSWGAAVILAVGGLVLAAARLLAGRPPVAMAASISAPNLRLFGSKGSRSPLVNWYLHEIDCEYEDVDVATVDRSSPDYPHPFGQIPALQDGTVRVFESGAILLYLADRYGGLDTPEKRAAAAAWVVWANATLDPICFVENDRGGVVDTKLKGRPKALDTLDAWLATRPWVLGEEFSVADVAVASYLLYVLLFFPRVSVAKWPHVARYMAACAGRPAYARAFGADLAATLAARCRQ